MFILVLNFLAEESIGVADKDNDEDNDEDNNKDNNNNNNDKKVVNNNDNHQMSSRRTAPVAAAGRAKKKPSTSPKCSLPKKPVAQVAAVAANVDQLAADFARAELDLFSFSFQARYPHIFIPTPPLTSG